ncbi:MAG: sulfotransferase family protein [Caulobacteraceae bacterium]
MTVDLGEPPARMNPRMIFVPDRSVLYVAVPKTGCTTIKTVMAASVGVLGPAAPPARTRAAIHRAWRDREANWRDLTDAERDALLTGATTFRFTSVRNPFARAVSCYLNKIVDGPGAGNLSRRMRNLGVGSMFAFLDVVADERPLQRDVHYRAMADLCHAGVIRYDDIVRFETFEADLRRIMARSNLAAVAVPKPAWRNRTDAASRLHELLGPRECDLIRSIYRVDFETFGYPMDLPPA